MVDFHTSKIRWFAAVWTFNQGERRPIAYWFSDTEDESCLYWRRSPWFDNCTLLFTPHPILQVYEKVKEMQSSATQSPTEN